MKLKAFGSLVGAVGLSVVLAGCATETTNDDGTSSKAQTIQASLQSDGVTREVLADGTEQSSSEVDVQVVDWPSFWSTCPDGKSWKKDSTGRAFIRAAAEHCRRRDGSLGGQQEWSGWCESDIVNCDGSLRCGTGC
ncbi:hypothetical protein LVJ94_51620 [Pendulispora rubella]|uniref:Uncharacterized protein n=1 Tax=Pendulispora rubella TaxID=2741070 RepID=A0ABZ2L816_9BACT